MPSFHQTITKEIFFKHSECVESLSFPVKVQSVVQRILGWWEWVCSEAPRVAAKFCRWFITPQRSEVEVEEGELVPAAIQLQVTQSPFGNNCGCFLGWCRVQEIYFTSTLCTWLKLHLSEQQQEAAFHLERPAALPAPSDATETKEEGRSESLVHWLMKYIWGWGQWCAKRGFQPRESTAPWPDLSDHNTPIFPSLKAT